MIELPHKRTANESHYELPNGKRVVSSQAGRHYLNHDGRGDGALGWRKVDLVPELTANGWLVRYCHHNSIVPLTADGVATYRNTWGDGKVKNRAITLRAIDAMPVAGVHEVINGRQCIVYSSALGDADLVYAFNLTGISRYARVKAGGVGGSYRFFIGTSDKLERMGLNGYEVKRTGKKVLDTARMTSIGGDTYLRPIVAQWGVERMVLPVEIAPVDGGWVLTKSVPAQWDGLTDLWMDDTTTGTLDANANSCIFHSVTGTKNDTNWQSVRTAATGTQVDAGDPSSMIVSAWYRTTGTTFRIWRGYLSFTLSLPGATIDTAGTNTLVLNATSTSGTRTVACVAGTFASTSSLSTADYDAFGATSFGTVSVASSGDKTITLNNDGETHITMNGTTKFAILDNDDFANTAVASVQSSTSTTFFTSFGSYEAGTAPILNITYTPAASGLIQGSLGQFAAIKSLGVLAV